MGCITAWYLSPSNSSSVFRLGCATATSEGYRGTSRAFFFRWPNTAVGPPAVPTYNTLATAGWRISVASDVDERHSSPDDITTASQSV